MLLYLVQHGESKPREIDPERGLTEEGRRAVERVASRAADSGIRPEKILHSGKLRARETAEILAEILSPPKGVEQATGLAPLDDPGIQAKWLTGEVAASHMLVGHLPHLKLLASLLLTGDPEGVRINFRNGGIVCLKREDGAWAIEWILVPEIAL